MLGHNFEVTSKKQTEPLDAKLRAEYISADQTTEPSYIGKVAGEPPCTEVSDSFMSSVAHVEETHSEHSPMLGESVGPATLTGKRVEKTKASIPQIRVDLGEEHDLDSPTHHKLKKLSLANTLKYSIFTTCFAVVSGVVVMLAVVHSIENSPSTRLPNWRWQHQLWSADVVWWMERCVSIGSVRFGLPGIASQVLFFAPMAEMRRIIKEGSVGSLPLLPYSSLMINGAIWTAYGVLSQNPALWATYSVAIVLGIVYTWTFLQRCPREADWLPGSRDIHLKLSAIVLGTVAGLMACLNRSDALKVLGLMGVASNILMYLGPLAAIRTIQREKNAKSLPLGFSMAAAGNCSLWVIYGCYLSDPYIIVPSGTGMVLSVVQLALVAYFGAS